MPKVRTREEAAHARNRRALRPTADTRPSATQPVAPTGTGRAPKRGRGGSIRRLASGKWRALLPAKYGRASVPGGPWDTRIDAEAALDEALVALRRGQAAPPVKRGPHGALGPTVQDVVEAYIHDVKEVRGGSRNTWVNYRAHLNLRIRGRKIATRPIALLTDNDVQDWLRALRTETVDGHPDGPARWTSNQIAKTQGLLSAAWTTAPRLYPGVSHGGRRNPVTVEGSRRPRTKEERAAAKAAKAARMTLPTWDDLAYLLHLIPNRRDRLFVLALAWAGPRFREAASLPRECLLPDTPHLLVARVLTRDAGVWSPSLPKTGAGRLVPLPRPLWAALHDYQPTVEPTHWDLLFPAWTRSGRYRRTVPSPRVWESRSWADTVWRQARQDLADTVTADLLASQPTIPRDAVERVRAQHLSLTPKQLRAYAASVVVASGGDEQDAKALLGHETVQTTEQHYLAALDWVQSTPELLAIRENPTLTRDARRNALWDLWVRQYGDPTGDAPPPKPGRQVIQRIADRAQHQYSLEERIAAILAIGVHTTRG